MVFTPKLHHGLSHTALSLAAQAGDVDVDDEQEQAKSDGDYASVLIEITPFPSKPQQPLSSPSPSQSLEHIEQLKRRQEAQMQALFEEQTRRVGRAGAHWTVTLRSYRGSIFTQHVISRLAQQQTQIATQQASLLAQASEEQAQRAVEEQQYQQKKEQQKKMRQRELEQIEAERDRLQALQHSQLMQTELVLEQQRHYLDAQEGSQGALFAEGCEVQCTGTGLGSGSRTSAAGVGVTQEDQLRPPQKKQTRKQSVEV
jgi:hypothetical protein